MGAGARTPEELETLLEDAFVLHDPQALAQLFQPGATLVVGAGLPEARGRRQIAQAAAQQWDAERSYLADPRRILQVRDTALVVAGHATNVARRTDKGSWRYAISLLDLEQTTAPSSDDQKEGSRCVLQGGLPYPAPGPRCRCWW